MSIFEFMMLVCFGFAWPASIYKSWKSKSTGGKSLSFLIIIELGYVAGILYKLTGSYNYVFFVYVANAVMVMTDIVLYFRNLAIEKKLELCKAA